MKRSLVSIIFCLALLSFSNRVIAATFTVANGDVAGLIAAINAANSSPAPNTINLASGGTYILTAIDNGVDGLPAIYNSMTINGNGAIIQRSGAAGTPDFRIFHLLTDGTVTFSGLTIRNGRGTGDASNSFLGGGIFNRNSGTVNIINCMVTGNSANYGGGISNPGGTVNIINSTISHNSVTHPTDDTGGGNGGGINTSEGTVTLVNSTISDNSAFSSGGGIFQYAGTLKVTNSTITGNSCSGAGGAIHHNDGGVTEITNNTIVNNSSGVYNNGSHGGSASLRNTIVALNSVNDLQGFVTSYGHNLIGNGSVISGQTGDQFGVTATALLLGPLSNNDGPTQTMPPACSSIAINAGDDSVLGSPFNLSTDQRGVARKYDLHVDIGAFEASTCNPGDLQTAIFFATKDNATEYDVFRFEVGPNNSAVLRTTFTDPSLLDPIGLTLSPVGELFVVNNGTQGGFVSRFLNPASTAVFDGSISAGAEPTFYGAFRNNELFVVQRFSGVLRFVVNPNGSVTPNGQIPITPTIGEFRGVTVSPWGELFISEANFFGTIIHRFVFDVNGTAQANGTISDSHLRSTHGMVFSPWGELFVTNPPANTIGRFTFDPARNASYNGSITGGGLANPIDLSFAPWGELFVGNQMSLPTPNVPGSYQGISRFSFNAAHVASSNGTVTTPLPISGITFEPAPPLLDCVTNVQNITVPATTNPWLAGLPAGAMDGPDSSPAQSPTLVNAAGPARLTFSASGTVANCPWCASGNPDGTSEFVGHGAGAVNGIGQVIAPVNSLIGVFLDANAPNLTPAPALALDFSTPAARDYLSISPQLKQPFFIGNGLTSNGVTQKVVVPAGATRLLLGSMDGSEWNNNVGSFAVIISADCSNDPTPASVSWNNPADITYGTPLSATQLNAMANVPGTFTYTPAAGTVLNAGNAQVLSVTFTPQDQTTYTCTSKQVNINVIKRNATWTTNPNSKTFGSNDPAPLTSGTGSNFLASDGVTASYTRVAGETVAGSPYHISANLSASVVGALNNYNITNNGVNFTIVKASTSTSLTSSLNPSVAGQSVTFTATVASTEGTPTGTVQFFDYAQSIGSVSLSAGHASLTTAALAAGSHSLIAVYSGDANHLGNNSALLIQTVAAVTPIGSNVDVIEKIGTATVQIEFSNVTAGGTTTVVPISPSQAGTLPGGFSLPNGDLAFDIVSTATFVGPITVCFKVPSVNNAVAFSRLRVLHTVPKLDVAATSPNSNNVRMFLGNGSGGFNTPTSFAAGNYPQAAAKADFNGDGNLDLAVANSSSSTVSVFLGNGAGGLGPATNFAVFPPDVAANSYPISVGAGDFNGDGKPDLAVANYAGNNVSLFLGNGAGGFVWRITHGVGANPRSIALGDFNGDGRLDLAVANANSNNVAVLLGTGDGAFSAPRLFAVGQSPFAAVVGDFNRDGKLDLAVANYASHTVSVLLGNGAGNFALASNIALGNNQNPLAMTIGDFNGDGKLDLATANAVFGNVEVLLGNGSGGFGAGTFFQMLATLTSVTTADFNNDGKLDLVTGSTDHGLSVRLGLGNGNFGAVANYAAPNSFYGTAVGNFNGDLAVVDQTILSGPDAPNFATRTICARVLSFSPIVIASADDETAPVISNVSANPSVIWPPNHDMIDVTVNYDASDDFTPGSEIVSKLEVSSNEPVNATGDGNTEPDIEIVDAHHVRLRAERSGNGDGRVYTVTITCRDSAQNTSTATVTVTVPKSQN